MSCSRGDHMLVLFDMDGTLLNIGLVHREAVRATVKAVFGLEMKADLEPHVYHGNTQLNILRAVGERMGMSSADVEARLAEAITVQSALTISALEKDLQAVVLPGVEALLASLSQAGHVLGLVTGTVRPIAEVVLERSGLARHFQVCVCGDDGAQRIDLLHLAIERAQGASDWKPDTGRLVVVGDAIRDIEAAKELGARVVVVATGGTPADVLRQHEPDAVLESFKELQAAVDAITADS